MNGVSRSLSLPRRRCRQASRAQRRSPPHPPRLLGRRLRLVSPRSLLQSRWLPPCLRQTLGEGKEMLLEGGGGGGMGRPEGTERGKARGRGPHWRVQRKGTSR